MFTVHREKYGYFILIFICVILIFTPKKTHFCVNAGLGGFFWPCDSDTTHVEAKSENNLRHAISENNLRHAIVHAGENLQSLKNYIYSSDTTQHTCDYDEGYLHSLTEKWSGYRLADALSGWYFRDKIEGQKISREQLIDLYKIYGPNFVVSYFQNFQQSPDINLQPFYTLIKSYLLSLSPKLAVIHIRTGDTMCDTSWDNPTMYRINQRGMKMYTFPGKYYEYVSQELRKLNVKEVIISTSTYHSESDIDKNMLSMKYISKIKHFFEDEGFRTNVRLNCDTPDNDYIFMSSAKIFVQGGGGYSRFISRIVEKNNGTVIYSTEKINNLEMIHACDNDGNAFTFPTPYNNGLLWRRVDYNNELVVSTAEQVSTTAEVSTAARVKNQDNKVVNILENCDVQKQCVSTDDIAVYDAGIFETVWNQQIKTVGGDEFFITKANTQQVIQYEDLGNGKYKLLCDTISQEEEHFRIIMQYTCGMGRVEPPAKQKCVNNGARIQMFDIETKCVHISSTSVHRTSRIELNGDVFTLGGKLMQDFVTSKSSQNPRYAKTTTIEVHIGLNLDTVDVYHIRILKQILPQNKVATLILGTSRFDILEEKKDVGFKNHILAMEKLFTFLFQNYPKIHIIWKGLPAVHVHKVNCVKSSSPVNCAKVHKYMSSSRANTLHTLEKQLTMRKNIEYLDIYNYTYANPQMLESDSGMYYNNEMNNILWNRNFIVNT